MTVDQHSVVPGRTSDPVTAPVVWTNWAGQQRCAPERLERPGDEATLAAVVAGAADRGLGVRAVGSGHSFGDICLTDGCLVDLSRMDRLLDVDRATGLVRVQAGITIHRLAEELHAHGLALENQGDVDGQSLAGAFATATHGTGAAFANMPSGMVGGRLVTADGAVLDLDADEDPDVLRAARVSLGALGVLSEITLRTVPAFRIHKREEPRGLSDVLDGIDELVAAHDHLEVYAVPFSDRCLLMASDRTDDAPDPISPLRRWVADDLVANRALELVQRTARRWPRAVPALGRITGRLIGSSERLDHSHLVYASERRVRFTEMEYAVPRAAVREAVEGVLGLIERRRLPVCFPIEIRFTAPDDALLSTAHGRETAYVAVHQYVGVEYETYFRAVESLMDTFGGRPHWGKRHYQTAATLRPRYPAWERFAAVRDRLDPTGVFTNAYVARTLGPAAGR